MEKSAPFTVLCVDDEVLGLQIRKALLEHAGFAVITALNGQEALALFQSKNHSIQIVLLDYLMPGMNGGEVALKLRALDPKVPILMHTACVDLPDEVRGLVDDVLSKGEGPQALLHRMQQVLEASQLAAKRGK
ncbi:response regulator [Pseudacidobacterium ailaaui]|jgi:CheY-like chemotaxis protein|uniref:response regulator n=1 Tax=Pseudacidobacterium ailaaui TaxID=1382359 RepID=UPI0005D1E4DB|nr:response regulator [Pseudacidobacterium ailaaui]